MSKKYLNVLQLNFYKNSPGDIYYFCCDRLEVDSIHEVNGLCNPPLIIPDFYSPF